MSVGARNLADVTRLDPPGDPGDPQHMESRACLRARRTRERPASRSCASRDHRSLPGLATTATQPCTPANACGPDGELESIDGSCSCPVVYNSSTLRGGGGHRTQSRRSRHGRPTPGRSGSGLGPCSVSCPRSTRRMPPEDLLPPARCDHPVARHGAGRWTASSHGPRSCRPDLQPLRAAAEPSSRTRFLRPVGVPSR